MTSILFICHGNICRSTMAQCVMQHLVNEAGLTDEFVIDSAAVSNEEIGNPIYPGTRDELKRQGVPIIEHRARRITRSDAKDWDYIVCMDESNLRFLRNLIDKSDMQRVYKLMDFVTRKQNRCSGADLADPWYTRNFERTYDDVLASCTALLKHLTDEK